jgi:ATP-binding cassette subfamily B protein AbcA/BmrA
MMNNSLKELWQLIQKSQFSKGMASGALLISIVETIISLAVPLFTMNMINDFSNGGVHWKAIGFLAVFLVCQAILSGFTFYRISERRLPPQGMRRATAQ